MIELKEAEEKFMKYTEQFDTTNPNIQRKIGHSLRVMKISKDLAKRLNLDKEKIEIATLIGLLHDIGRFEQYTKYQTYNDLKSIDHGMLGVEILEREDRIKEYYNDEKYIDIIKTAIRNHNGYQLEKGLTEEETLFCKIIKDADKIDILYEASTIFWKEEENKIEKSDISEKIKEQFHKKELINKKYSNTLLDNVIGKISYVYDINFKESFEIIHEKRYIENIINRFNFNGNNKEEMQIIKEMAIKEIEEKIK